MGQQGSNTTFRVGGTARQAGGNWTGRFENPEGLNAWHSMYGSRLEPGDTVTVGDVILKWNGSAYKVIDGDFVDGPTANAWAANFIPELASGSTATIAGVPSVYRGPGAGWSPSSYGPIYNGTTLPFPVGGDCIRIRVVNPAVPKGWSWLEWNGVIWTPPAGELIAAAVSSTTSPVALVTPGALTLAQIYATPVIPDYMIPNLLQMDIVGDFGVTNGSGVAGALLGIGLCGSVPVKGSADDYPLGLSLTPSVIFVGITSGTHGHRHVSRRGSAFYHQNGGSGQASGIEYASTGTFVAGNNKLYAMGKASHVNDTFRLEHIEVYSRGNL